jgi:hypothetical protein
MFCTAGLWGLITWSAYPHGAPPFFYATALTVIAIASGCAIGIYFYSRVAAFLFWSIIALVNLTAISVSIRGEASVSTLGFYSVLSILTLGGAVGVLATFLYQPSSKAVIRPPPLPNYRP